MSYLPIQEITAKFAVSERTVYLKLKNNPQIRRKKAGKTKLIHVADFAEVMGAKTQLLQSGIADENSKSNPNGDFQELQSSLKQLQDDFTIVKIENEQLQKFNTNLQSIANDRALALTEMKSDLKNRAGKYESLNAEHNQTLRDHFKKFYLTVGLCAVLVFILLFQNLPSLVQFFEKFK